MSKTKKYAIFFAVGGITYIFLELLWRGYTHWSMVFAGGISAILISLISEKFSKKSIAYKAILCAISITAVELFFGIVFNIILKMNVWDYSDIPFNLFGQICPSFTLLWGALGFVFIPIADRLNKKLLP